MQRRYTQFSFTFVLMYSVMHGLQKRWPHDSKNASLSGWRAALRSEQRHHKERYLKQKRRTCRKWHDPCRTALTEANLAVEGGGLAQHTHLTRDASKTSALSTGANGIDALADDAEAARSRRRR
jgi:hypothetical protein